MPILRGSVTFARFRVQTEEAKAASDVKRWLVKGLKSQAFEPIDRKTEEERAAGFVELEDADASEFPSSALFHGERALFTWRVDQLKISGATVKAELQKWQAGFEKENARRPSRAETAERRGALRQMLRSKATPLTKTHDVSWNLKTNELQLWTSSRKIAEEIQVAMESAFEVKLLPVTPGQKALDGGIAESALGPTAELLGVQVSEVANG